MFYFIIVCERGYHSADVMKNEAPPTVESLWDHVVNFAKF